MFVYNWKLPAYSWASLLRIVFGSFFAYNQSFFQLQLELFLLTIEFFAYSGKVHVISTFNKL